MSNTFFEFEQALKIKLPCYLFMIWPFYHTNKFILNLVNLKHCIKFDLCPHSFLFSSAYEFQNMSSLSKVTLILKEKTSIDII
jgi:hypothetical protein